MPTGRTFLNGFDVKGDKWSAAYIKTRNGYIYAVLHNGRTQATYGSYTEAATQFDTAVTKPAPIN